MNKTAEDKLTIEDSIQETSLCLTFFLVSMQFIKRGNPMRTIIIFFTVVYLALTLLSGCGGMGDWAYDKLPSDYWIARLNAQDIQLVRGTNGMTVVGRYIIAFSYNARYIGLKRVSMEDSNNGPENMETLDTSQPEFYLIDTLSNSVYGPLTEDEYKENTSKIDDMSEWISTDAAPPGADWGF